MSFGSFLLLNLSSALSHFTTADLRESVRTELSGLIITVRFGNTPICGSRNVRVQLTHKIAKPNVPVLMVLRQDRLS